MTDPPSFDEVPEGSVGPADNRVYGQVTVRGPEDPPAEVLGEALAFRCGDCNVNVEVYRDDRGVWGLLIAHDDGCPWLEARERDTGGRERDTGGPVL